MSTSTLSTIADILIATLSLQSDKSQFNAETILLGGIAELDSIAVINVVAALEEYFGITIEDEEISGKTFETLGSLTAFVDGKLQA